LINREYVRSPVLMNAMPDELEVADVTSHKRIELPSPPQIIARPRIRR
jgi:hypothetical protein